VAILNKIFSETHVDEELISAHDW